VLPKPVDNKHAQLPSDFEFSHRPDSRQEVAFGVIARKLLSQHETNSGCKSKRLVGDMKLTSLLKTMQIIHEAFDLHG
jgi:hypothetical protein